MAMRRLLQLLCSSHLFVFRPNPIESVPRSQPDTASVFIFCHAQAAQWFGSQGQHFSRSSVGRPHRDEAIAISKKQLGKIPRRQRISTCPQHPALASIDIPFHQPYAKLVACVEWFRGYTAVRDTHTQAGSAAFQGRACLDWRRIPAALEGRAPGQPSVRQANSVPPEGANLGVNQLESVQATVSTGLACRSQYGQKNCRKPLTRIVGFPSFCAQSFGREGRRQRAGMS